MNRLHWSSLPFALTRPSVIGLPEPHTILAACHDERTYTLLVTDGTLTQLATGRVKRLGAEHVTLTPPLLEFDGLAHGAIPAALLNLTLPGQSDEAGHLTRHLAARPPAVIAEHLRGTLRRHDPHHALRIWRSLARQRAQVHEDFTCGVLTLPDGPHTFDITPSGLLLDDGTVLSPDILDTL